MAYGNEKYSDEELEYALVQCNGQPTKAAEMLGVDYVGVWRRIKKNPKLKEVQEANRSRTFNNISNVALTMLLTGIVTEPETDEEGNVIEGKFIKRKVDYRTRTSLIPNLIATFKGADGIKDEIEISSKGSVNIEEWLKLNNSEENE